MGVDRELGVANLPRRGKREGNLPAMLLRKPNTHAENRSAIEKRAQVQGIVSIVQWIEAFPVTAELKVNAWLLLPFQTHQSCQP